MNKKSIKRKVKKKSVKIDPLSYEKQYLLNIINLLDRCAKEKIGDELRSYFQSKADLNRDRLRALK